MLEAVHEWLAHYGFALIVASILAAIALRAWRRKLAASSPRKPASPRQPEGARVAWGPTGVLLAGVAVFTGWFGAASAGVMTEWPRQQAFARSYVERSGTVTEKPPKGMGEPTITYESGGYTGSLTVSSCGTEDLRVGQPVPVYVSLTEPSRASLERPRDPYTAQVPELILVVFVLPVLAAATAFRGGVVVRARVSEPTPGTSAAATGREVASPPFWRVSLAELSPVLPASVLVALLIATALANSGPDCFRREPERIAWLALTGPQRACSSSSTSISSSLRCP